MRINTILFDLDDVLINTQPIKDSLLKYLYEELKIRRPKWTPQKRTAVRQRAYDFLKVEGNPEKIASKNFPAFDKKFTRALRILEPVYSDFMNRVLFSEENRTEFFKPPEGLLKFLNWFFHDQFTLKVCYPSERLSRERSRLLCDLKFDFFEYARISRDSHFLSRKYHRKDYVLGLVSNGESQIQRKKSEALLKAIRMADFFDFVMVSGDKDVQARKPMKKFYDVALRKARRIGSARTPKVEVEESTTIIIEDRASCFPEYENNYIRIKIGDKDEKLSPLQQTYYNLSDLSYLPAFLSAYDGIPECEERIWSLKESIANCEKDIRKYSSKSHPSDEAYMREASIMMDSFGVLAPPTSYSGAREVDKERYERWIYDRYEKMNRLENALDTILVTPRRRKKLDLKEISKKFHKRVSSTVTKS